MRIPQKRLVLPVTLIVLLSLLIPELLVAQRKVQLNLPKYDYKKYHFGFILGVNQMLFTMKYPDDFDALDSVYVLNSSPEFGFNIGIVSNLRLAEHWDMRFIPTLSFGERIVNYTFVNEKKEVFREEKKVESTNIDFPLNFKFKSARINNFRAYLLTGAKYTIDLASQAKKKEKDEEIKVKLKSNDLALEVGVGFDFYTTYFKFGTELKMSYGIRNLLVDEDNIYTDAMQSLRSKIFQISFTFE